MHGAPSWQAVSALSSLYNLLSQGALSRAEKRGLLEKECVPSACAELSRHLKHTPVIYAMLIREVKVVHLHYIVFVLCISDMLHTF